MSLAARSNQAHPLGGVAGYSLVVNDAIVVIEAVPINAGERDETSSAGNAAMAS